MATKKNAGKKSEIVKDVLSPKEELFCQLYATDREFFANGTQAYIEAFDPDKKGNWYLKVRSNASYLLTKSNILFRINELLELQGLNDVFVDKQLTLLITQNADFSSKLGAIREYNNLKKRIEAGLGKITVELKVKDYNGDNDTTTTETEGGITQVI